MKKITKVLAASLMIFTLVGCGATESTIETTSSDNTVETVSETASETASETVSETVSETASETAVEEIKPETITIKSLNGNKEEIELEIPYDPERIAILDMAALDIIDNLGLGSRVVGTAGTSIDYLQEYITDDIPSLGTIKEADLEATMAVEPDVIFIGGRLASSYDALAEIAPVVYLATDTELGVIESTEKNATIIASLFGLEDEIANKMEAYKNRINALQEFAAGKTVLVGMTTSGGFNILGNDGRCSIIGVEIGFENLGAVEEETSTHGNESSFEVVVDKNPDYIFVMDRDSAINTEGAVLAQEIMENELVMQTDAYKNGTIVYLEHPNVWYTGEGGITALDVMLQDLEKGLIQ